MIHESHRTALLDALVERHVDATAGDTWGEILAGLHPKQRAFVEDTAWRKCGLKGRRAGGSFGVAAWLCKDWQNWAGLTSLFVAQTKEHAKTILWATLELFDSRFNLGIAFNGLELSARFPNGYTILLKGAKDKAQVEKLRGFARGLVKAAVDEVGSFGVSHDGMLRYLVESVITPQLMDHRHRGGGHLALLGSPGRDPIGLYFERTTGRTHEGKDALQWPTHHWTALDNPHVDARSYLLEELAHGHVLDDTPADDVVEALLALRDVPQDDPAWSWVASKLSGTFRQEYLAHWVKDAERLVYIAGPRHLLAEPFVLPKGAYRVTIGCDIGWGDGNGFTVCARRVDSPLIYVLRSYYLPELSTHGIALELGKLRDTWRTGEIYVDTGGEGQRLLKDLEHYGVLAMAAGKGRKRPRIEYARSLLENGSLQIVAGECSELLAEWTGLPWSPDHESHREGFVDDVTDSFLMAVNPLSQRFLPEQQAAPNPGEPGYVDHRDRLEHERAVRQGMRIKRRERRRAA